MGFFEKLKKTFTPESREFKYNLEAMRQLRNPFTKAVEKIKEEIDQNVYDVLLSDDASGRLPTLALKDILTGNIEKTNPDLTPEEKRDVLKTFFVAGGRFTENNLILRKFLEKMKSQVKKRVLLVTEYIATGKSIKRLMDFLDAEDIPYDVLGVIGMDSEKDYQLIFKDYLKNHKIIIGDYGREEPRIYSTIAAKGVDKPYHHHAAHPRAITMANNPKILGDQLKEDKEKSREDVHTLARETVKKVWNEKIVL